MAGGVRLIFPVEVTVKPIDKTETIQDSLAREPIRQVSRSTDILIDAQVQWQSSDQPRAGEGGPMEDDRTYLVFLIDDLETKGYTPARGDKVLIPRRALPDAEVYLDGGFEPAGHKAGQANLLLCFWQDRQPTKLD